MRDIVRDAANRRAQRFAAPPRHERPCRISAANGQLWLFEE
ncbi:hypothetical protein [Falsiroseomonas frigidaquae]|nr:hypothetical protein [Falsiroseomonas frigidaquae]